MFEKGETTAHAELKVEHFHSADAEALLIAWHSRVRLEITLRPGKLEPDPSNPAIRVIQLTGLRDQSGFPLRCYSQLDSTRVPLRKLANGRWHGVWVLPPGVPFRNARDCYYQLLPEHAKGRNGKVR